MRSSCRSPLCFLALSSSNICLALEVVTNVLHRCYQPEFPLVLMMEDGITNSEGSWLNVVFRLLCISCIDYRQLLRDLQFKDPFALLCHACSTSPDTDTSLGIFIQTWWRDFSVVPPNRTFTFDHLDRFYPPNQRMSLGKWGPHKLSVLKYTLTAILPCRSVTHSGNLVTTQLNHSDIWDETHLSLWQQEKKFWAPVKGWNMNWFKIGSIIHILSVQTKEKSMRRYI